MHSISISNIVYYTETRKRAVDHDKVVALAEAFKLHGRLLQPIVVDRNGRLIDGLHRLLAWRKAFPEKTEIACIVLDFDEDAKGDLQRELAEIDANLIRNDLDYIGIGEHAVRRNEILDALGLRAKVGRPKNSPESGQLSTMADLAKEIGIKKTVLHENMQLAVKLLPEAKKAVRENDTTKYIALELSRLTPEEQRAVIEGGEITIEAMMPYKPAPPKCVSAYKQGERDADTSGGGANAGQESCISVLPENTAEFSVQLPVQLPIGVAADSFEETFSFEGAFKVNAGEMVRKLAPLRHGTIPTPMLPQSDCVVFIDAEGKDKAYTYSGEVFAITDCAFPVKGAVNYKQLLDAFKGCGDAEVEIGVSDTQLLLKDGAAEWRIQYNKQVLLSLSPLNPPDPKRWQDLPASFAEAIDDCEAELNRVKEDMSIIFTGTSMEVVNLHEMTQYSCELDVPGRFAARGGNLGKLLKTHPTQYQKTENWFFLKSDTLTFAVPVINVPVSNVDTNAPTGIREMRDSLGKLLSQFESAVASAINAACTPEDIAGLTEALDGTRTDFEDGIAMVEKLRSILASKSEHQPNAGNPGEGINGAVSRIAPPCEAARPLPISKGLPANPPWKQPVKQENAPL